MASTSNGGHMRPVGVNAIPDNSDFDLDQGLADTVLWINGVQLYEHLEDPECNDPSSRSTIDAIVESATDLFQISEDGDWASANSVPMQLLHRAVQKAEQERAALLVIYSKAKVEGNCITTTHHAVVVKLFLRDLMLSENGIEGVPHPKEYALLLSRLCGELGTYSFDADSMLDPADYAGCLGEMLKDMEETRKILDRDSGLLKELEEVWGPDVCVYVRRATGNYAQCLLAAADALNLC